MNNDHLSLADIIGPWIQPEWDTGLIERCRNAWNKPLRTLTNEELATLLRQRIAVKHLLPIAQQRLRDGFDDDTELSEGELQRAVEYASDNA
jgi:hypothetical protein